MPGPYYAETLRVPLRWWALGTMFWASVLLAFLVALPPAVALGSVGALALLTAVLFIGYGGARVELVDGTFRAGRARIPVRHLTAPTALAADEVVRVAGPAADARAFLVLRPYLPLAIKVDVTDPADPTPYWLVSTRHPTVLATALEQAIGTAARP